MIQKISRFSLYDKIYILTMNQNYSERKKLRKTIYLGSLF
jgi:hypothetical protein